MPAVFTRDTGIKRREWPSHILGSGTLGQVAVILGQTTSASAQFSVHRSERTGPHTGHKTRPVGVNRG